MQRGKGGLSTIIVTLILILVSIVAVGIVWLVVRNIIQTGTEGAGLSQFSISAKILDVSVDNSSNNISFTLKRNAGKGELTGVSFVFSSNENTEVITRNVSLKELEQIKFIFHLYNTSVSDLISVSIIPLIKQDGKQISGIVLDKYNLGTSKNNIPSQTTCVPSSNPCGTSVCGNVANGTCGQVSCGSCSEGENCANGNCQANLNCSANNVLCVDDTMGFNQEYSTIQSATNVALAGDTILVYPGNYNERITFPIGYHGGESGNRIIFKANTPGTVIMKGFLTQYADYITIDGFNITNTSVGQFNQDGIFVRSNNVEILSNYFYNINGTGITTYGHPSYSKDLSIKNNRIYHSQAGIIVFCDNCLVEDNEVNRLYDYGNYFMSDNDYARFFGSNITFRNNYFHGSIAGEIGNAHLDCFMAFDYNDEYVYNVLIENNICTDFEQVIGSGSQNGRIKNFTWRNNLFYNGWGNGLNSRGGALNKGIEHNYVYNNIFANIRFFGGLYKNDNYTLAYNNIFYNTKLISYNFINDPSSEGDYNLMFNTNYPPNSGTHDILGSDPLFRNLNKGLIFEDWNDTVKHNYFYDNSSFYTESYRNDFIVGDFIEYCSYYTGCDGIARNITSIIPFINGYLIIFTPLITNLSTPDCKVSLGINSNCGYLTIWGNRQWTSGSQILAQDKIINLKLLSSSPAINSGTSLSSLFATDLDGVSRPQGSAWDIGAYEYV